MRPGNRTPAGLGRSRPAFLLGCLFLTTICFPGLLELPGGVSGALVVMLAGAPFWFAAARLRTGPVFDPRAGSGVAVILWSVTALIGWASVSAMGAEIPFRSGRSILALTGAFATYWLVVGTLTGTRLERYLALLCATLAATCLVCLLAFFQPTLRAMIYFGSDRAFGFFDNSNQFGMAISTLLPVTVGSVLAPRGGRRAGWAICAAFLLIGLVLSGSKANMLLSAVTLAATATAFSLIRYRGTARVAMIFVSVAGSGLLLLIGYGALSVFNPRAIEILAQVFSPTGEVQSLDSRSALWADSLAQFAANPVTGVGASQLLNVVEDGVRVNHSHNVALDYLRTLGVPGVAVFLIAMTAAAILCLDTFRMALRSATGSVADRLLAFTLPLGAMSYLAANMSSDSMGPSTAPFFWVVLFLGIAARGRLVAAPSALGPARRLTGSASAAALYQ